MKRIDPMQILRDMLQFSKRRKRFLFGCLAVLAGLLSLSGCTPSKDAGALAYSIDDLSVDTDVARKEEFREYGSYKGRIIKVTPKNGLNWDDWSRPVFLDLNEYRGQYKITISMSVWVESAIKLILSGAPSFDPEHYPKFTITYDTEIYPAYNPTIGWTLQNGGGYKQFGGKAVEPPKGQWTDLVFSQTVDLSDTGNRRVFVDGLNESQGLVDLVLFIRHFKADLQKIEGEKYIALTFDDGPSDLTGDLLDKLDTLGIKATFFLLGMGIDAVNPQHDSALGETQRTAKRRDRQELVKRIFRDGHDVANHSYSHNYLGGGRLDGKDGIDPLQETGDIYILPGYTLTDYPLSEDVIRKELEDTQTAIQKAVYGNADYFKHPWVSKYFRTPFCSDETKAVNLLNAAGAMGLPIIYGQGSGDYIPQLGAEETAHMIYENRLPWGVSINHDPQSAPVILEALDIIVPRMQAEGYEFVTLSGMLERRGTPLSPGKVYSTLDPDLQ